ncbi:MAG: bifunctional phosphoribosylaminoimidazolecarboxamide formyltransferase/IMP cyclohydrolase [Alphaproteobacteria bacterium]|nr:bifunctional phosphoribosylaminoimidazolecarboxamide formyltransferase/IMP cyclohydrolase [Alphaproteobacteria bacterium]
MSDLMPIRRALLSVSDKTGLLEFAQLLDRHNVELLSTGGTARTLRESGLSVTEVSEHTGFPEMLDGRVKTLHPTIHGGILAKRCDAQHQQALQQHNIAPIDLVVVNLYPFAATVAKGADFTSCIENIDIGGPAMIRSASKNHEDVTIVVDPSDYIAIGEAMESNKAHTTLTLRKRLAAKAYAHTASYDAAISTWFTKQLGDESMLPETLNLSAQRRQMLRYGENPHQQAAWYSWPGETRGLASCEQIQGKELSYNNINDTDAALALVQEFDVPAVAIIKHANPCGVAVADTQAEAFVKALACDPQSAFGGIIALNRPLSADTVTAMGKLFVEVIIAPAIEDEARNLLASKKNLRVLIGAAGMMDASSLQVRPVAGGLLVQTVDSEGIPKNTTLTNVSKRSASAQELKDMQIAFTVAKHVKSNAIVIVKNGATLGIGAGQMSRVDSVRIATHKAAEAGLDITGAALASDAFFPFDDNIHLAAKHGITALIQPGGSIRDDEVVAAANQHNMAMVTTGIRHFRH